MATTILSFSSKSAGGRRPCLDRRASNHRLQPHDEGGTRNSNLTIHSEDTYMNDYFNLRFRIAVHSLENSLAHNAISFRWQRYRAHLPNSGSVIKNCEFQAGRRKGARSIPEGAEK